MTWIRVDDALPEHPKIETAGPVAAWLYVCGLAYASRNLTDGFIPENRALALAGPGGQELIDKLVRVNSWERIQDGYQIHDYLDYQQSRAETLRKRKLSTKRQEGWRQRQQDEGEEPRNASTNASTNASRNALVTASLTHVDVDVDVDVDFDEKPPSKPSLPEGGLATPSGFGDFSTVGETMQDEFAHLFKSPS